MIKVGDLVLAHGQNGVFIVRGFSKSPDMAELQLFSVSKQQAMDFKIKVPRGVISPFKGRCQPGRCPDREGGDGRTLVRCHCGSCQFVLSKIVSKVEHRLQWFPIIVVVVIAVHIAL